MVAASRIHVYMETKTTVCDAKATNLSQESMCANLSSQYPPSPGARLFRSAS